MIAFLSNLLPSIQSKIQNGLNQIGRLGSKIVRWFRNLTGTPAKTHRVAQPHLAKPFPLAPQQKTTTPAQIPTEQPQYFIIKSNERIIPEHLRIIQDKVSVPDYIGMQYKGNTPAANKYSARLRAISKHLDYQTIIPTRGDGNCFTNAAAAGLLHLFPLFKEKFLAVLRTHSQSSLPYLTPDKTSTAPTYSQQFTKKDDFNKVITHLMQYPCDSLLKDQLFLAAFSRVIRFILHIQYEHTGVPLDENLLQVGENIDMLGLCALNHAFDVNAALIVLRKDKEFTDPDDFQHIYRVHGKHLDSAASIIPITNLEKNKHFYMIASGPHYILLTRYLQSSENFELI